MVKEYKPKDIRVKKNKNGFWQTVFVENHSNGKKIPYGNRLGYKCSMFQAKKIFANDINRSNKTAKRVGLDCHFSVHKDYYLGKNKK